MNEFEQFIASNYGLQPGDPVDDDTLRKASADFLQSKSAPAADLSGLTGKPKNVLEDFAGVSTPAPRPQALETPVPENTQTRLGLVNDSGMGTQSVLMEPTLVEGNPLVSFAAATPDEPVAEPQAQPQQQKAGRDWGSFHEIMPYRQSDLKLMAPEMETKNFNRDVRQQAAQLRNRWNAEFDGDRQFFAGYGIYDLETADEVTRAPAELRMKAAQIIEQKLERGEVPDWVTTIKSLREGGTSDSVGGSTGSSAGSTAKPLDIKKALEDIDALEAGLPESRTPDLDRKKINELRQTIRGSEDPYERVNSLGSMISQVEGYKDSADLSSGVFMDPITEQPIVDTDQARTSIQNLTNLRQQAVMDLRQSGPEAWEKISSPDKFQYQTTPEAAAQEIQRLGLTNVTPEQYLKTKRRQEWNAYKSALPPGSLVVDYTKGGVPMLEELGGVDPRAGITTEFTSGDKAIKADRGTQQLKQLKAEKAKLEESRKNIPRLVAGSGLSRVSALGPGSLVPPRERTDEEMNKIAVDMEVRKKELERRIAILEQGGSLEE
jgi:hypothetical protein